MSTTFNVLNLPRYPSAPTTVYPGASYYNTTDGRAYIYDWEQSRWEDLGTALQLGSQFVTSLPAAGGDGQLITLQANAAQGINWQFRYRTASASAHKWEFIGGPPLHHEVLAQENTQSYVDWALLSGPYVTLPTGVGGDFVVDATAAGWMAAFQGGSNHMEFAVCLNGSAQYAFNLEMPGGGITYFGTHVPITAPDGATIELRYRMNNGSGFNTIAVANRSLKVTPVRVS